MANHRSPAEIEAALEVLNDQMIEASPLERPALELAAQNLAEKLFQLKRSMNEDNKNIQTDQVICDEYFDSIQKVDIKEGLQKYVLIRIPKQGTMTKEVYLVRGDPKAEYHYQAAEETVTNLRLQDIESDIVGGGRIDLKFSQKEVEIYGHSYQYGRADHSISARLIKEHLGSEFIVSFGDYGY